MVFPFNILFYCCLRTRTDDGTVQDETSRLIPVLIDQPVHSPQSDHNPDQQRVQERLGHIVRNTQGKMVNVSARLPFNLNNQNLSPRSLNQSSSRSQSKGSEAGSAHPTDEITGLKSGGNGHRRGYPNPSPSPGSDTEYSEIGAGRRPMLDVRLVTDTNPVGDHSGMMNSRGRQSTRANEDDSDAIPPAEEGPKVGAHSDIAT